MKHVVRDRSGEFPEAFRSIWLAGPDSGLDSCAVLVSRVPPGHRGPRLHTHPVDQFYFVLYGETTVQIGDETFKVPANSLVHFPAGVPHCNWNETEGYESHLELLVPAPPQEGILTYFEGEPPRVPDAARLIRSIDPDNWPERSFAPQHLAMREWGSRHARIYAARVKPGARGPALHFHDFDQLYFILGGEFQVRVGHQVETAAKGDLVVLPRATVHENWNAADRDELHLTILVPEPAAGQQFDYKVDVRYESTPAFR